VFYIQQLSWFKILPVGNLLSRTHEEGLALGEQLKVTSLVSNDILNNVNTLGIKFYNATKSHYIFVLTSSDN
jgi:hypothetical protein